jgi:2-haloacid dehalogenase
LLRHAFALSASGIFHTFPDIATGSLALLLHSLGREGDEIAQKDILGTFSRLPAYRDVKSAHEK